MKRTATTVETMKMKFDMAHACWKTGRLTQEAAAGLLGVSVRTFQRYIHRQDEEGPEFVLDRRVERAYERGAPLDEVQRLLADYRDGHLGWNVRHYYARRYLPQGGERSYNWVRLRLQEGGLVEQRKPRGRHFKKRERKALPGMMLHQDGSTHEWLPGRQADLIVTMDDATGEHYSMFLCEQEGVWSSFRGMRETLLAQGLPCTLYTDRGSHYWNTPAAGGKVDKANLTQFGRSMAKLGVQMIPAYSPQARGRSERAFGTHQDRLVKELAAAGCADLEAANRYIQEVYLPTHNAEFAVAPREAGSAFVPLLDPDGLDDILCERYERTVGADNCIQFGNMRLQIPANRHRLNYVKARVEVRRHEGGSLSVYHGPRLLARYAPDGALLDAPAAGKGKGRAMA